MLVTQVSFDVARRGRPTTRVTILNADGRARASFRLGGTAAAAVRPVQRGYQVALATTTGVRLVRINAGGVKRLGRHHRLGRGVTTHAVAAPDGFRLFGEQRRGSRRFPVLARLTSRALRMRVGRGAMPAEAGVMFVGTVDGEGVTAAVDHRNHAANPLLAMLQPAGAGLRVSYCRVAWPPDEFVDGRSGGDVSDLSTIEGSVVAAGSTPNGDFPAVFTVHH